MEYFLILFLLVFFHFLADYPLQGDFLSRAKNRHNPIQGVPWYQAMVAHSFIHAFFVFLATGYFVFFVVEFFAHMIIDDRKCAGELTFNEDQAIHLILKFAYVMLIVFMETML